MKFEFTQRTEFIILLVVFGLFVSLQSFLPSWMWRIPETWFVPVADWINNILNFLLDELWILEVEDEGFIEEYSIVYIITRSISGSLQLGIDVIRNILLGGNKGFGLPALPWTTVAVVAFMAGYVLKGWKMALFVGLSVVYLAVFGQWEDAMYTLSLVLIAGPIAIVIGLLLAILSYKNRSVELALNPILNIAQTLPHFSYLIPVVVFYGLGDHAGAIATIIFATPAMIRLSLLGFKTITPEIIEAGKMSGCNEFQLLTKVLIPSAQRNILLGVNQVIMQCLAMVVIASFIGASGLGYSLLVMLNSLRIGQALELGVSIVLIAVILDRLTLAWALKPVDYRANLRFYIRYKYQLITIGLVLVSIILAKFFPSTHFISKEDAITTAKVWNLLVDWIVDNWSIPLQTFRTFFLLQILIPMRDLFASIPIIAIFILVGGVGFILGRIKSAIIVSSFFAFIVFTGWWDKAIITIYMVTFSVITATSIGLIVGIIFSRTKKLSNFMLLVCDTFQTFPSFVYLIPVVMLFQVNDVSVIFAVVIYATIPATRYTIEGLKNVPESLQDAASMSGVNSLQRLFKIEMPLAFPHIMIGVSETVTFSLFMVIIGAFIGTQDLGQDIMQALSESDMGKGLVLGLCVAFLGLAVNHIISLWSFKRKQNLGIY